MMGISKPFVFFVLLVLVMMITTSSLEGDYSKIFSTIGLECKCCDGEEGECTKSWHGTCSNFQCSSWKQYSFRKP
ncbi:hypothetical protein RDI58_007525 [Solanum bulbocastanum]|uniref:Transmembrane protein n=1 Tax=Solanum bulbocastanum TaxID=147425 RepID=A0AAN8U0Z7_SOLBU